jgi:hypothetical protein
LWRDGRVKREAEQLAHAKRRREPEKKLAVAEDLLVRANGEIQVSDAGAVASEVNTAVFSDTDNAGHRGGKKHLIVARGGESGDILTRIITYD